jgi:cysteine desulfurase / selenocysteine lyase
MNMGTHRAAGAWRSAWFEIEDAAYLNTAAHAVLPRVSVEAVQASLEAKRFPHHVSDSLWFEVPNRIRASLATLIGAKPEEIALTTGASTGVAAVAHGLTWRPGDEIITAEGEFPLQYATWKPMEEREGVRLKTVVPQAGFITADDLIAAMTPKTRVISVSHVRFDDGSRLDAARVAAACHAQEALLVLDASQSCGAMPLDVSELGADVLVGAGYKWLLGPYGTGFCWVKAEVLDTMRPGPVPWSAQPADTFSTLNFVDPEPSRDAKRWDTAEAATSFNFNLAAMDASVRLVSRMGPASVFEHNRRLIDYLFERLPDDCAPASPMDATQRGAYGCFTARDQRMTAELYRKLRTSNVVVSMREGRIRVSPHLFNSLSDIDRLIDVVKT